MKLKKRTIFYSILYTIAIFVIVSPSIYAQNIVLSDDKPTLSVIGESEKQIPSDQTKISLAVENTASDSNIVRKDNAEKMSKIISALTKKGLTNKNISTSNFEIRPNYDNQNNNYQKIISYTALNGITIITSKNVNISSFIDLAVNNGANRIASIEFITSKKVTYENYNELLKEAFSDAKQKADTLSTQGGFIINGVKKIDIPQINGNMPFSSPSPNDYISNSLSLAPKTLTPIQILPQENKLSINLPVTFFIKNKIQ